MRSREPIGRTSTGSPLSPLDRLITHTHTYIRRALSSLPSLSLALTRRDPSPSHSATLINRHNLRLSSFSSRAHALTRTHPVISRVSRPDRSFTCGKKTLHSSPALDHLPKRRQECPSGLVSEELFKDIFARFFPQGGESRALPLEEDARRVSLSSVCWMAVLATSMMQGTQG